MNPLEIAEKYVNRVIDSGTAERYWINKHAHIRISENESRALAKEALWLAATENPTAILPTVLVKAEKLYHSFLRIEYKNLLTPFKGISPDVKTFVLNEGADKCELESEVYHCLDLLIQKCGIHLGLWAILSYILQEPKTKAQTIFQYMKMKPTRNQQFMAGKIVNRLKKLL